MLLILYLKGSFMTIIYNSHKTRQFSLKMLASSAVLAFGFLTSQGYGSTQNINIPSGEYAYVGTINAAASTTVNFMGGGTAEVQTAGTYHSTAATTITNATVQIDHIDALGSAATNSITLGNGSSSGNLILNIGSSAQNTVPNNIIVSGSATNNIINIGSYNGSAVTTTLAGAMTGSGNLLFVGAGATQIAPTAGANVNTFSGTYIVDSNGTLELTPAYSDLTGITPALTGVTLHNGATLILTGGTTASAGTPTPIYITAITAA
jgi:hypothetical protein